ncbi:hypothetical protein A5881_001281 [Enterococcus termitis]
MNQAMKLDNIMAFIKETNTESIEDKNFIFGYIEPKFSKYLLFQAGAVADLKNFLVFFTNEEIILVELNHSGDFTGRINHLERKKIADFKYKSGLTQTKIIFKYDDIRLVLKTPQVVLTSKWQMTNLKYLKEKNFFWK